MERLFTVPFEFDFESTDTQKFVGLFPSYIIKNKDIKFGDMV